MVTSIFFLFSALLLTGFLSVLFYREFRLPVVSIIPLSALLTACFHAFLGSCLGLLSVSGGLLSIGLGDLAVSVALFLAVRKTEHPDRKPLSHITMLLDLIVVIGLFILLLLFAQVYYGFPELSFRYLVSDPAQHLVFALDYMSGCTPYGMTFSQINNALGLSLLTAFFPTVSITKLYVVLDLFWLYLAATSFYGAARAFRQGLSAQIGGAILTVFYVPGYPLAVTLFGFSYLGMALSLVPPLALLVGLFTMEKSKRPLLSLFLLLLMSGIALSYALFIPPVFLAVCLTLIVNKRKDHTLFTVSTIYESALIGAIPLLLAILYLRNGYFGATPTANQISESSSIFQILSIDGANYTEPFVNFLFLIPLSVLCLLSLFQARKESFSFSLFLLPTLLVWMSALAISGSVSDYYFYKNHFLLWVTLFLLIAEGLPLLTSRTAKISVGITAAFFLTTVFVSPVVSRQTIYAFNRAAFSYSPYAEENFALIDAASEWTHRGFQIPCLAERNERLLYDALTEQRITEESEWVYALTLPLEELSARYDGLTVWYDSVLYQLYAPALEAYPHVYENEAGFLLSFTPAIS